MADPKITSPASMKCFPIDDYTDDQEIFTMALQAFDYSFHSYCVDGVKVLEKLQDDNSFLPQFIFIDIDMLHMNRIKCLE